MRKAYQTTSTPVARSQEDIRKILSKYGASGVQFTEDWSAKTIIVRFRYVLKGIEYFLVFKVPIPQAGKETPTGREKKSNQVQKQQEQYERGIWRAVYWAIKSRMEAVEFGIETFQDAFLSHFEIPGTDGKTVGEAIIPRLESGNIKMLAGR